MNTHKKLWLWVTAVALLSLAPTNAQQQRDSLEGFMSGIRANAIEGSVPIQRRDWFYDFKPGIKLELDDILKSDPDTFYDLLPQPGNCLRVGPDTELQLLDDQLEKMKLKLNQGAISFEI